MMKYLGMLMFFCLLSAKIWAEDEGGDPSKNPLGCKNVGYHYRMNSLEILPAQTGEHQSLYFFYNRLAKPVKLYHMLGHETAQQTFLNHTVAPQQWAVLATGLEDLKYICTVEDPKKSLGKIVNCQESIKVCEFARVKFGLNNKGNFWVVNGNTRGGAVAEVVHYGIIPQ